MQDDAHKALKNIPVLADYDGPVERLGGLTNQVYRAGDVVLRLPGPGTEEYINRADEKVAAEETARVGVSPEVLFVAPESGVMVTRFVAGATTMSPDAFRTIPGAVRRAGEAFRALHTSDATFATRFDLFGMIDEYLSVLSNKDVALPEGYHDVVAQAEAIRPRLEAAAPEPVASHCDPLCENFLDTGTRMWIVDWEYAGMNDPMWDLGDLSVEGGFDAAQDEELLEAYFNGPAPSGDRGRMVVNKAMCDLLWTLWGLIQVANKNPAEDFTAYAEERFARCKALMESAEFADHVAAMG
ncbi:MAG: choline/ethanolamine kinase family protein [Pseudomonadota bacterium]